MWIYDPSGPLNEFLQHGRARLAARKAWLGDFDWALPAVGLIGTWVTFGLCMVLFVAGVQKIPTALYDAARVDGAGLRARVLRRHAARACATSSWSRASLTTINALRNFDIIYNTTAGGPGRRDLRAVAG